MVRSKTLNLGSKNSVPWVAVIDDDSSLRDSVQMLFQPESWLVKCYRSGEDFFAEYSAHNAPACILLDQMLSGMRGLDVLHRLRQIEANIPALLLTAYPTQFLAHEVSKLSVELLTKPIASELLLEKVKHIIDRHS